MLVIAKVASPHRKALHVRTKVTRLFDSFRKVLPARLVDDAAKRSGYGERRRKCPPDRFFWTMVLGFACEAGRSLASLQRFFCAMSGESITSSAFQKRFTPQAADFFQDVLKSVMDASRAGPASKMGRKRKVSERSSPFCARMSQSKVTRTVEPSCVSVQTPSLIGRKYNSD